MLTVLPSQLLRPQFSASIALPSSVPDTSLKELLANNSVDVWHLEQTRRHGLIKNEKNGNNPEFLAEAVGKDRQTFMPFDELERRCDYHAQRRIDAALRITPRELYYGQGLTRFEKDVSGNLKEAINAAIEMIERKDQFDVICVAVPHRRERDIGSFPGECTPLLTTTCVTEALLRAGLFPSQQLPHLRISYPPYLSHPESFEIWSRIVDETPRVVALSTMAEGHPIALEMIRGITAHSPNSIIIQGGSFHDGTNPRSVLRALEHHDKVRISDRERLRAAQLGYFGETEERRPGRIVVCNDGPFAFAKLLQLIGDSPDIPAHQIHRILKAHRHEFADCPGVFDIYWWDPESQTVEGIFVEGKSIDRNLMPFMSRGVNDNYYHIFKGRTAQMMVVDGCVESCSFCGEGSKGVSYPVTKLNPRTAENVLLEIDRLIVQGIVKIFMDDSYFLQRPSQLTKILDGMIERRKTFPELEWGCQTTMDSIIRNAELLPKLRAAGCSYMYIGLEGADPQAATNTKVSKAHKPSAILGKPDATWMERFQTVAELIASQPGMRIGASLIFGMGEDFESTVTLLNRIAGYHKRGIIPDGCVALNALTLYPETTDHRLQTIVGDKWVDYRQPLVSTVRGFETLSQHSSLSKEEAEAIVALAHKICGAAIVGYNASGVDLRPYACRVTNGVLLIDAHDGYRFHLDSNLGDFLTEQTGRDGRCAYQNGLPNFILDALQRSNMNNG